MTATMTARLPRECSTNDGRPKVRYLTRADAKSARRQAATKYGVDYDDGLRPYRCDECGYFHLGHKPTAPRETNT